MTTAQLIARNDEAIARASRLLARCDQETGFEIMAGGCLISAKTTREQFSQPAQCNGADDSRTAGHPLTK